MRRQHILVAALTCASALALASDQRPPRLQRASALSPSRLRSNPMAVRGPFGHNGAGEVARTRAAVAESRRLAAARGLLPSSAHGRFSPNAVAVGGSYW